MMFGSTDQLLMDMAENEWYRMEQNQDFRRNTKFANSQTLETQRKSDLTRPINQITGFTSAGFSPLASLGNVAQSPVTSSNVAMPVPKGNVAPSGSTLLELEQAKNLREQTEKLKIDNNRKKAEDSGAYQAIMNYADSKLKDENLSPAVRNYWESVKARPASSFNFGDIQAEENFKHLVTTDVDTTANAIKKGYENYLWQAYKAGDKALLDLNLQKTQIGKLISEIANIETNTILMSFETLLKPHEAQKLDSEVARNLAEAEATYHGDVAALWKNGDFQALLARGSEAILNTGLRIVEARLGGPLAVAKMFGESSKQLRNGRFPNSNKSGELKENLLKAQKKNERIRKYVEQREQERRRRANKPAFPL